MYLKSSYSAINVQRYADRNSTITAARNVWKLLFWCIAVESLRAILPNTFRQHATAYSAHIYQRDSEFFRLRIRSYGATTITFYCICNAFLVQLEAMPSPDQSHEMNVLAPHTDSGVFMITSTPTGVRNIEIGVSVCLSVCLLSVCPFGHLKNMS